MGKITVSRVINKNGAIKESTRLKVEAAMKELNYRPSLFAQGIKTGRSKTIALVVPDSTNLFYSMLLSGIEDIARKYGYFVMLCNGEYDSQKGKVYLEQLQERNIDGIIYCVYRKDEVFKDVFELSETVPVVFTDHPYLRHPLPCQWFIQMEKKRCARMLIIYIKRAVGISPLSAWKRSAQLCTGLRGINRD